MEDILDIYAFGTKVVISKFGSIFIGRPEVLNSIAHFNYESAIKFNWQNVDTWYNIFYSFILKGTLSKATIIDEFNISFEYCCFAHENKLRVQKKCRVASAAAANSEEKKEQKGKDIYLDFTVAELTQALIGISYVFVSALCLPPPHAHVLNQIICNLSREDPTKFGETETKFQTRTTCQILDIYEMISYEANLSVHVLTLHMCLQKYDNYVLTLVKMRLVKEFIALEK